MKFKKYSTVQLKSAVAKSTNYRQVLIELGLTPKGGNYKTLRKSIKKLGINTFHFKKQYLPFRERYPVEALTKAVNKSTSLAQVLGLFDVPQAGGNQATLKRAINAYKLDTSHFTGQVWSKGKTFGPKRDIKDYFDNKVFITTHHLRLRLLKEGIFTHKCYSCLNSKWLGKPIPLELDHVDGNTNNNNLSNLKLLCPNCHSLTPTHRGKNKGKYSS